jgi:hypothetical protein
MCIARAGRSDKVPRAWIWIAGLFVLGLLALDIQVERARAAEDPTRAAGPTPVSVNRTNELRLRGWATRSRVSTSGSVRVYLTVENRSDKRIDEIDLSLTGQGFEPSGPIPVGAFAPGAATTHPVDLKALNETSSGIITSRVDWKIGKIGSNTTLAIGPVEVRAEEGLVLLLSRAVLSFFKDLALPIVLVLLAYAVQHLQQEKTSHEETFHAMLPRAHENIVRFLLPIGTHAGRFLRYLPESKVPRSDEEKAAEELALQQAFFHLLFITKGMRSLSQKGGGIFFTNIPGETAVSLCWKELLGSIEKELGAREISEILDEWGRAESFTSLQKRFKTDTNPARDCFTETEKKFKDWIERELDYERRLLRVFKDVMQYEIDKIYGAWYREEPAYAEESRVELERLEASTGLKALKEALREFRESLPVRQKKRREWFRAYRSVGPLGKPPGEAKQNSGGVSTRLSHGEPSDSSNSPVESPIPNPDPPPPAP